ncbi:MAG: hypothetical protein FWF86_02060 [Clostridia bacterium]|nr:hypothetical protein [Clostridia bacterium]
MASWIFTSPISILTPVASEGVFTGLRFGALPEVPIEKTPQLHEAARRTVMYFRGERRGFGLPPAKGMLTKGESA